jgi:hypothetical protein
MFRSSKRKKVLTQVVELNDLLAADSGERARLVGLMPESVAKGLLVYLLAEKR